MVVDNPETGPTVLAPAEVWVPVAAENVASLKTR